MHAPWLRHQMETFSALLALCAGNSPLTGEFPSQRPVTRSFYVFFDLRLNKRLSKQSWGWWFETPLWSFWCHCNDHITVCRGGFCVGSVRVLNIVAVNVYDKYPLLFLVCIFKSYFYALSPLPYMFLSLDSRILVLFRLVLLPSISFISYIHFILGID